ncbi:Outer membrane protein beta-barrel domain-containing protein [Chryseobacterium taeanense]|uniref:Outer membrane protein beta-barrel domain-containing protein n=2 Tax=Chryseobacterium taeanense TaxID=311334 RepID=A0A1G8K083_9FLAO|nr:Outer membrane protein beta-barrel domain-containing protein [Chryseobacterium taeanense]
MQKLNFKITINPYSFMNRKLLFSFLAALGTVVSVKAQRNELGVRLGMSNLVGDIGRTNYILQKPLDLSKASDWGVPFYGGILYRFNFNPHQTVRLDLGYNQIQFSDKVAKEEYRKNRNSFGKNNVYEASLVFEYNFFPVNNEQKSMVSPYIFGGVGALMFDAPKATFINDFKRDADGVALAPTNELDFTTTPVYSTGTKTTMNIPFGVGLKYKFNYNWAIFAEATFRYTLTDQLDYSKVLSKDVVSTYNADILSPVTGGSLLQTDAYYIVSKEREAVLLGQRNIGDGKSKDWMNTISLGLTYSFGRPPCYCD